MPWEIPVEEIPQNVGEIKIGLYSLADELAKIQKLKGQEMSDAIALYSGRIVEAMSRQAIELAKINVEDITETATNLDMLYLYGEIDQASLASAHSLRRFGNEARHPFNQQIGMEEEPTIVGLLQFVIEWYACKFPHGLNEAQENIANIEWPGNKLLRRLAFGGPDELMFSNEDMNCLLNDRCLAGFAGERLIDCKAQLADAFTDKAFKKYRNERRLVEMRALFLSRNGNSRKALAFAKTHLEPRLIRNKKKISLPEADPFGILGGAYKNYWIDNFQKDKGISLEEAHKCYSDGSKLCPGNYYLRVNVAATALWLGAVEQAKNQAKKVLEQFQDHPPHNSLNYWLAATLAEANFLAGNHDKAHGLYELAKNLDTTGGRWERTRQQLAVHLNMMGQPELDDHYNALP